MKERKVKEIIKLAEELLKEGEDRGYTLEELRNEFIVDFVSAVRKTVDAYGVYLENGGVGFPLEHFEKLFMEIAGVYLRHYYRCRKWSSPQGYLPVRQTYEMAKDIMEVLINYPPAFWESLLRTASQKQDFQGGRE